MFSLIAHKITDNRWTHSV